MYLLTLLAISLVQGSSLHENVVFRKVNEVTMSRSQWLVTFVIDLEPYERLIVKLTDDIDRLQATNRDIISKYSKMEQLAFADSFIQLGHELKTLSDTYYGILQSYTDYKSLYGRERRSVLPFVGKALHFLFGTVTDSELESVRRNVNTLSLNQAVITHVVKDSLTLLNATRVQVSENRQTLNELIKSLSTLEGRLNIISHELDKRLTQLEAFVNTYFQVELVMTEIKQIVGRVTFYFEHLQLQLNMLSLGRLAPSTITPNNLKKLLLEIEAHLPTSLHLPGDPEKNLWKYYQMLTCKTVLEKDKIFVIVPVPLLDQDDFLEIFQIQNLPVPMGHVVADKTMSTMTAQYTLEATALAVDKKRTRFALLDERDLVECTKPSLGFCSIKSPMYPINLNKFCVVALFMKDSRGIRLTCQSQVMLDSILPMAQYLAEGVWAVSTNAPFRLNVVCKDNTVSTAMAQPPVSLVKLNKSCSATSNELFLTPYFETESMFENTDSFRVFTQNYVLSNVTLWRPFQAGIPPAKKIKIPKELETIKHIPMNHLIDQLKRLNKIDSQKHGWSWMKYLSVVTLGCLIVACGVIAVYLFHFRRMTIDKLFARVLGKGVGVGLELDSAAAMVETIGDDTSDREQPASAPLVHREQHSAPGTVRFYPSLEPR